MMDITLKAAALAALGSALLATPGFAAPMPILDPATGLSWLPLSATNGMSYDQLAPELAPGGALARYSLATFTQAQLLFSDLFPMSNSPTTNFGNLPSIVASFGFLPEHDADGMGTAFDIGGVVADAGPAVTLRAYVNGMDQGATTTDKSHSVFIGDITRTSPLFVLPKSFILPDSFAAGFDFVTGTDMFGNTDYSRFPDHYGIDIVSVGGNAFYNLGGTLPDVTDGFFLVQNTGTGGPIPVPEPGALALLTAGFLSLAGVRLSQIERGAA